VKSSGRNITKR